MRIGVRHVLAAAARLVWLAGCETTSTCRPRRPGQPCNPALAATDAADPPATGTAAAEKSATAGTWNQARNPSTAATPTTISASARSCSAKANLVLPSTISAARSRRTRGTPRPGSGSPRDDRLKRFDLADHAYDEVLKFAGPTPAILNNQGYSYIVRGEYDRAREKLLAARASCQPASAPTSPCSRKTSARTSEAAVDAVIAGCDCTWWSVLNIRTRFRQACLRMLEFGRDQHPRPLVHAQRDQGFLFRPDRW